MLLRSIRILRSQRCRAIGGVALLAAMWFTWWVWPPRPEFTIAIKASRECPKGEVTADGRSLVCVPDRWESFFRDAPRPHRFMLFELPSGERKLTVSAATELC